MHGLSLVAASRGYSSLQCLGFSLRWLLLLQSTGPRHVGSVVVTHGLSCPTACGLPRWLRGKESACSVGDAERCPGERKWPPTLVLLPGISLDGGAWRATVHGVTKAMDTTERLNNSVRSWFPNQRSSPGPLHWMADS